MDLRSRVLAATDDDMSCRSAAARFGVAPSTAIRWHGPRRDTGSFAPKPQGDDMGSCRVEERRDDIGLTVSRVGLHRFFVCHGITRKKDQPRDRARALRRPDRAAADGLPARPSQNYHPGRRSANDQDGGANGPRRPNQRRMVRGLLRREAERTVSGLWSLIGWLVDLFKPAKCANYFKSCGYEPD